MASQESCAGIIQHIKNNVPVNQPEIMEYLTDMESHYTRHPCQKYVSSVIASLATRSFSIHEFHTLISRVKNPDTITESVIESVSSFLDERDIRASESAISYILSYAEDPNKNSGEYLSFRDFIEYAYYITYPAPNQDPKIHPWLNSDILFQSGRICALKGERNRAREIFSFLSRISPVNAAILFELAEIYREERDLKEYRNLTNLCFQYAWKPGELARAYRNMGYFLTETDDYTGAVTCYLMGTTWEESSETARELMYIKEKSGEEPDIQCILSHGKEILDERNIPFGPNPRIIELMADYAEECKQDGDLFEARKYLSHAKALELSDRLEREIEVIERFIEDSTIF
ncbi:tetratricopeptide repeat protein [Methanospirillum sp.]|uniref:tetratricopeptide repeat protein n=1 Tax=Methanospirillum sp. TaxID=45200 RepID=UPI0035A189E9